MIEELAPGIVVVGTAHVSPASVALVESTIRERKPKKVLVELDPRRLEALQDPEAWRKTDIIQVLRQGKQYLFLLQLYLASVQARMGRDTGVAPGAELLRAVEVASEVGAEVVLIDRDIAITLKRGFSALSLWARLRLFWNVWVELLTPGPGDQPLNVEEILQDDAITKMTQEFARFAPAVKVALIDERDAFMASHIAEQGKAGSVVAVVGAGHLAGIRSRFPAATPQQREPLLAPPPKRFPWLAVLGLLIPLGLATYIGYLLLHGQAEKVVGILALWVTLHLLLAGIGAALARGHPAAVLTGALAAPLTSILPVGIKSGWLAGFVQAKMRTPNVADFEAIKRIETLGEFWGNGIVRILTVTALTILGSEAASIVCGILVARGYG